ELLREGGRLRVAAVAAQRHVSEAQSRYVALAAARETLGAFAVSVGAATVGEGESFETAATRLDQMLKAKNDRLNSRLEIRRRAADVVRAIRSTLSRRHELDERIASDTASLKRT